MSGMVEQETELNDPLCEFVPNYVRTELSTGSDLDVQFKTFIVSQSHKLRRSVGSRGSQIKFLDKRYKTVHTLRVRHLT